MTELDYFKIFTKDERTAAKASAQYRCNICNVVAFYADIWNIRDHLPPFDVVCVNCRVKHSKSFEIKRKQLQNKDGKILH